MNTTETREVTVKELVAAFGGKFVSISSLDRYGISIQALKGTLEMDDEIDDNNNLWIVARDEKDRALMSICIDEDSIESIEDYGDDTYTINFTLDTTRIEISECKL
jgi:hypothetical protein